MRHLLPISAATNPSHKEVSASSVNSTKTHAQAHKPASSPLPTHVSVLRLPSTKWNQYGCTFKYHQFQKVNSVLFSIDTYVAGLVTSTRRRRLEFRVARFATTRKAGCTVRSQRLFMSCIRIHSFPNQGSPFYRCGTCACISRQNDRPMPLVPNQSVRDHGARTTIAPRLKPSVIGNSSETVFSKNCRLPTLPRARGLPSVVQTHYVTRQ
jgi:hypothetical protein